MRLFLLVSMNEGPRRVLELSVEGELDQRPEYFEARVALEELSLDPRLVATMFIRPAAQQLFRRVRDYSLAFTRTRVHVLAGPPEGVSYEAAMAELEAGTN